MEMKPVIFLDIDGVMATENEYGRKNTHPLLKCYPFNKGCVKVLNSILEEVDADIVLSSDWKLHYTFDQMNEIFAWNNVTQGIVAVTESYYQTKFKDSRYIEECRANEILDYIEKYKVTTYVAVDDLHMGIWLNGNFVYCGRSREGIKQNGIKEKIIKILKPKE
jgi:hypothetical protein